MSTINQYECSVRRYKQPPVDIDAIRYEREHNRYHLQHKLQNGSKPRLGVLQFMFSVPRVD